MAKKRMAWETAHYLGVVAAPETEDHLICLAWASRA